MPLLNQRSEQPHLLDRAEACRFFGGSKPINSATLYRGIRRGRYPRPVKVGPGTSRWLREECQAALQALASARTKKETP
jgi:predicted DNA-binding transcriptional regulator AlpA